MLILTLSVVAILSFFVSALWTPESPLKEVSASERWLASRKAVLFVGAVTLAVLWYCWASWNPIPAVHDEMAYVLQSEIFAKGHWALPSPPMPMFWQQPHVLTEPMLTSKYFPGHSITITPGILLGWAALMPLLLNAMSACLLFVLVRRIASGGVALLAWVIWLISPMILFFAPGYYSEVTTSVCWLGGWYALLRWRDDHAQKWLLLVAFCTGWDALTRPLTGVAYALPVGLIVLHDVWRERRWKDLVAALAVGILVMAILPVWCFCTTGNWTLTPLTLYTRQYMPYDVPGLGLITTPAQHLLTPELVQLNNTYSSVHIDHLLSNLPVILVKRWLYLMAAIYRSSGGLLAAFGILGLFTVRKNMGFAISSAGLLFLLYLSFATPPQWSVYYLEATPVFAAVTACGMAWCASLIGRFRQRAGTQHHEWRSARWTRSLLIASVLLAVAGVPSLLLIRSEHAAERLSLVRFQELMASIHDTKAVVFVRYSGVHNLHVAFVRNVADLENARLWVVYDRGERENAALLGHAKGRTPYLFDEVQRRLYVY